MHSRIVACALLLAFNDPCLGQAGDARAGRHTPEAWSCSDESLLKLLRSRDPTGLGLPSFLALRLLQVGAWNNVLKSSKPVLIRLNVEVWCLCMW